MSKSLINRAARALCAVRAWGMYGAVLLVLGAGLTTSGDWALRGLVNAFDDALVRTPIDSVADEAPPVRAQLPVRVVANEDAARSTAKGFDHARPSPRLFERIDESKAERLKAAVSERVVAAGSTSWYSGSGRTYTTICVRLCDGAHFPVSYSTSRSRFATDEQVCKSRCAAPARLFAYPNPGGSAETAVDRDGHSYVALPTAFQFKRGKAPGCSCRPEAWEEASRARHLQYAAAELDGGRMDAEYVQTPSKATQSAVVVSEEASVVRASLTRRVPEEAWTGMQTASLSAQARVPDVPPMQAATEVAPPTTPVKLVTATTLEAKPVVAKPVKVATLPHGTKRKSSKKRPRSTQRNVESVEIVDVESAGHPTLRSVLPVAQAEVRLWGRGPNSVFAPRGSTAGEIFARNFY